MKTLHGLLFILAVSLFLSGCIGQIMTPYPGAEQPVDETTAATLPVKQEPAAQPLDREMALAGFQKGGCGGCHIIPGAPGATGVLGPISAVWVKLPLNGCRASGTTAKQKPLKRTFWKRCRNRMPFFPRTAAAVPARRD